MAPETAERYPRRLRPSSRAARFSTTAVGLTVAVWIVAGVLFTPPRGGRQELYNAAANLEVSLGTGSALADDHAAGPALVDDLVRAGSRLIARSASQADTETGLALLQRAVEQGSLQAAYELGAYYLKGGKGVGPDPARAQALLEQAAAGGIPGASIALGIALLRGEGLPADPPKGIAYLAQSAKGGADAPKAAFLLGQTFLSGAPSVPAHSGKAQLYLKLAVAAGYPNSAFTLGRALLRGEGMPANPVEGADRLEKLLAVGDHAADAAFELGSFYLRGASSVAADPSKARSYLDRAIEAGHPTARIVLGRALLRGEGLEADPAAGAALLEEQIADGKNVAGAAFELGTYLLGKDKTDARQQKQARAYLEQAITAGHRNAPIVLGRALLRGEGLEADPAAGVALLERQIADGKNVAASAFELGDYYLRADPPNPKKARAFLDQAVAAGNGQASMVLAHALISGDRLPADPKSGVALLQRRIAEGSDIPAASFELGTFFLHGGGGKPGDPSKARSYLEQARAAGHPRAALVLGRALLVGEGLPADPKAGIAVLDAAAKAGDNIATSALFELGRFYLTGSKDVKPSANKARGYLEQAAAKGYADALVELASAEIAGKLGAPDGAAAINYLEKAIGMGGAPRATVVLAHLYLDGKAGVSRRVKTGLKLLSEAADAGNAAALRDLISLYMRGMPKAVPRDLQKARSLLAKYQKIGEPGDVLLQTLLVTAAESRGIESFRRVSELFIDLPSNKRPSAARQLFFINQRAALYIIQAVLKSSEFYAGPLDGKLNAETIRAIQRACSSGREGKCGPKPLTADTIGFIAANFS